MNEELTTNQVKDMNRNPQGKGGFGDHPENRNDGRWKKEASFTYWMNKFKNMSLLDFKMARETYDGDQWTVAAEAAYVRVEAALGKELANFEAVADRTEGKAPQTVKHEGGLFANTRLEMVVLPNADTDQPEATADAGTSEQSPDS